MVFAKLLRTELKQISDIEIELTQIKLNPANPMKDEVSIGVDVGQIKGKTIIIVDDVANTGRTIFYAIKPLLQIVPGKVEVAVLIDRKHKSFPIKADYVGLALATTLKENIDVQMDSGEEWSVYLD